MADTRTGPVTGSVTVTAERCRELVRKAAAIVQAEGHTVDLLVGLSSGGLAVATFLAKVLDLESWQVVGVAVVKRAADDGSGTVVYEIDERYVAVRDLTGVRVWVVDEASNSGALADGAKRMMREHGAALVHSLVLIANEDGVQPDKVVETCTGRPPQFFWEEWAAD